MIAHVSLSKTGASQGVATVVDQFEKNIFLENRGYMFWIGNTP